MAHTKDFITIRLDHALKAELQQACEVEQRSLSNLCRLLLEFAWAEYLRAGSMQELILRREQVSEKNAG